MVTLKTVRRVSIILLYILLHTTIMNSFAFARSVDPVHNVEPIESSVSQAVYSVTDQVYKTIEEISNSTDIRSPKDSYIVGFDSKTELVEYLNTEVISHEHIESVVNMNAVILNESDPVDEINTYNLIDAISIQLTDDEAEIMKDLSGVRYVEKDGIVSIQQQEPIENNFDTNEYTSWGLTAIGGDNLENKSLGNNVKIALLDTGISIHKDLNIHDGVSFVEGESYNDEHGHGTHVAGIIAAQHNGYGVKGVAPNSEIYSVKVLDAVGRGSYSQVIRGIEWAVENNMNIISMSFGGFEPSIALQEAIEHAIDHGLIVVAAAGNTGDNRVLYPAQYNGVISVGAINKSRNRATYSPIGKIDLVAPGTNVVSTYKDNKYGVSSGTSMAAAYVTGSLAVYRSNTDEKVHRDVTKQLYESATSLGNSHEFGRGLVNIKKALGSVDDIILSDTDDYLLAPTIEWSPVDSEVQLSSYDKIGNEQNIRAGETAIVSLRLQGDQNGLNPHNIINIRVYNVLTPSITISSKIISNPQLYQTIPYSWSIAPNTEVGRYVIEYSYPASPSYTDRFYINVVAGPKVTLRTDNDNIYVEGEQIKVLFSASSDYGIENMYLSVKKNGALLYTNLPVKGKSEQLLYMPSSGTYHVELKATDMLGKVGTASIEFEVDEKKHVVVYVPGFMGTEIIQRRIGGRNIFYDATIWPSILNTNVAELGLNKLGQDESTRVGEVFESYLQITFGKELLNDLRDAGVTVVKAPYDWRKDLNYAASHNLKEAVDKALLQSNGQPITIMSHSTGALVVRKYLIDNPQAKVKSFINIAGPNLGSPKAMKGLVMGDDMGVTTLLDSVTHNIVQNMPSVYQLLPGDKFINIQKKLYSGVLTYNTFYEDVTKHAEINGNYITNYKQTQDYILNNHNANMYKDALEFRSKIELGTISDKVKEYRLVGYDQITLIHIKKISRPKPKYRVLWGEGDSIVPIKSGDMNREGNAKLYYFEDDHVDLLRNKEVLKRVKNIVLFDRDDESDPYPDNYDVKGNGVSVSCPVDVEITDSSDSKAYVDEGVVINNIEGLSYELLGETKALFIRDNVNVHVKIKGYDHGSMNLAFTRYETGSEDIIPTITKALNHVAITPNTVLEFDMMGTVVDASTIRISYDQNGDGNIQYLNANLSLSNEEFADVVAPETQVQLTGTKHNDWYSSDVVATFSAEDYGASGNVRTYYNRNGEGQKLYSNPLTFDQEGSHILEYYSLDKAENYEGLQSVTINIDKTPPTSPSITLEPDRWTNNSVRVTLVPGQDTGSGVENVQYRLGTNGDWLDYSSSFTYDVDGVTHVYARSVDRAGNNSSEAMAQVKIDRIPPSIPSLIKSYDFWTNQNVTVTVQDVTDVGSGVQKIEYQIDRDGNWLPYREQIVITKEGQTDVQAKATDVAENVGGISNTTVFIDKTPPNRPIIDVSNKNWTNENVSVNITSGLDALSGADRSECRFQSLGLESLQ